MVNFESISSVRATPAGSRSGILRTMLWLGVMLMVVAVANANVNCTEVLNANPTGVAASCTCVSDAYTFDSASGKCICATNSIVVGTFGYCIKCSSLAATNSTNPSAGNASCSCNTNFVWNPTWKECVLACGTISNSVGSADGRTKCECTSPYSWNTLTSSCQFDCEKIVNASMAMPGDNLTCACKDGSTWNSTSKTCVFTCTGAGCSKCPMNYYYDYENNRCQFNCFDFAADVVSNDPNICGCSPVNKWDNVTKSCNSTCNSTSVPSDDETTCTLDCSAFSDTNSRVAENDMCTCTDPAKIWSGGACILACNGVKNANLTVTQPTNGTCICGVGYTWNADALTCDVNCALVANSNASGTPQSNEPCACKTGFVYRQNKLRCDLNCLNIPYINQSYPQSNNDACVCVTNFVWNATQKRCVLDCASIGNTVTQNTTSLTTCQPKPKYYWDKVTLSARLNCSNITKGYTVRLDGEKTECRCYSPYILNSNTLSCDIDCSAIDNTNGTNGALDCFCKSTFSWNSTFKRCDPNCSAIEGSTLVNGKCTCQSRYSWVSASAKCVLNCSRVRNANTTATQPSDSSCVCISSYAWDTTSNSCKINCSVVPNSNTSQLRTSSCSCISGYGWKSSNLSCVKKCAVIRNAVPNVDGPTIDSCVCKNFYSWNQTANKCDLNCSAMANAAPINDDITKCSCSNGFVWSSANKFCIPKCGTLANTVSGRAVNYKCTCSINNYKFIDLTTCTQDCSTVCRVDCFSIPFAYNADPISYTKCNCQANFNWVDAQNSCVVNCAAISQSTGNALSSIQCECNPGFTWSTTNGNCTQSI